MKKQTIPAFLLLAGICACQEAEFPNYDTAEHRLYFTQVHEQAMTFQHYLDMDSYELKFPIQLIGQQLDQDREIDFEVVDTATTAQPAEYTLPNPLVFHKGRFVDTLRILVHKSGRLKDREVSVAVRLLPNPAFGTGYPDSLMVKAKFSDILIRPDWWKGDLETEIFGPFTPAKYRYLLVSNGGITDLSGYSLTELRVMALKYKEDIERNQWKEDGSDKLIQLNVKY